MTGGRLEGGATNDGLDLDAPDTEDIGIKVNTSKTLMLCVSDAQQYKAEAFLNDAKGNRIGCQDHIKALGMVFGSTPNMNLQVERIRKGMCQRFWTLRDLKKNEFSNDELVQVYKTMLRPVAEYGCVVYNPSLTDEQDELLDRLQNHALMHFWTWNIC